MKTKQKKLSSIIQSCIRNFGLKNLQDKMKNRCSFKYLKLNRDAILNKFFAYYSEGAPVGSVLTVLMAEDRDEGQFARVTFAIGTVSGPRYRMCTFTVHTLYLPIIGDATA